MISQKDWSRLLGEVIGVAGKSKEKEKLFKDIITEIFMSGEKFGREQVIEELKIIHEETIQRITYE